MSNLYESVEKLAKNFQIYINNSTRSLEHTIRNFSLPQELGIENRLRDFSDWFNNSLENLMIHNQYAFTGVGGNYFSLSRRPYHEPVNQNNVFFLRRLFGGGRERDIKESRGSGRQAVENQLRIAEERLSELEPDYDKDQDYGQQNQGHIQYQKQLNVVQRLRNALKTYDEKFKR